MNKPHSNYNIQKYNVALYWYPIKLSGLHNHNIRNIQFKCIELFNDSRRLSKFMNLVVIFYVALVEFHESTNGVMSVVSKEAITCWSHIMSLELFLGHIGKSC